MAHPLNIGKIESGEITLGNFVKRKDLIFHTLKFQPGNPSTTTKSVDLGFIGPAEDNIVTNFGFGKIVSFDFKLNDDTTSKSTTGTSITNLSEQINYLENDIVQDNGSGAVGFVGNIFNIIFRITAPYVQGTTREFIGMVEDLSFDISKDQNNSKFCEGSITLKIGTNKLFSV